MLTITLPPELERVLNQCAQKNGTTAEQVALETLQRSLLPPVSDLEKHQDWAARLQRLASPAGVSLSEETLSREAMYE